MIPTDRSPEALNQAFATYMLLHGVPSPAARVVATVPPLNTDPETDCWTHAWDYATANPGALYVEGVCQRRGRRGIAPHAWVLEADPFGGVHVLELTETYEDAHQYRGFVVDHTMPPLAKFKMPAGTPRPSMIQLYAGAVGESISSAVRALVR